MSNSKIFALDDRELEFPSGSVGGDSHGAVEESPITNMAASSTERQTLEEAKRQLSVTGDTDQEQVKKKGSEEDEEEKEDGFVSPRGLTSPACRRIGVCQEEEPKEVEAVVLKLEDDDDCYSTADQTSPIGGEEQAKKVELEGEKEKEGDDGYHTPTSPSHRIPQPNQCPPAPRKSLLRQPPSRKRRERDRMIYRVVEQSDRSQKVKWIISVVEDDFCRPSKKKAGGE